MRCEACGMEYGVTHVCPAAFGAVRKEEAEPAPPPGFAPLHYLRQGWAIARWDEIAIRRASRDGMALVYGAIFFYFAMVVQFTALALTNPRVGRLPPPALIVAGAFTLLFATVYQLLYFVLCHFLVKTFLGGNGSFLGILRPMLLSSFLLCLAAIPYVGLLATGVWWGIAILLWVFEEVHHIERLKTLVVIVTMNVLFTGLYFYLGFLR